MIARKPIDAYRDMGSPLRPIGNANRDGRALSAHPP